MLHLLKITVLVLGVVLACFTAVATAQEKQPSGYRLQPGDVLEVSVWKEPELSKELLISPDGDIAFPLVGQISTHNKSIGELRQEIIDKLSAYIPEPSVNVALLKAAGNMYYVVGKVNRPGQYAMLGPTSVLQAISMAGGMTPYADRNDILVIRQDAPTAIPFRYGDMEDGKDLAQNIELMSGDVVLVP